MEKIVHTEVSKKFIWALVSNIVLFVSEVFAFVLYFPDLKARTFAYLTQDSNFFTMIISGVFIIYAIVQIKSKKQIPTWVHVLRYMSTCCLLLTFLIVVFVLIPLEGRAIYMMFGGHLFFYHTLCPIVSVLSFILFENERSLSRIHTYCTLVPLMLYSLVMILLNIFCVFDGPYLFLKFYKQAWYISVFWVFAIVFVALILSSCVRILNQQMRKKSI